MKIAAALAALGLALLTGCAPAEGSIPGQVEPITQGENGAQTSEEREESSMVRESGRITADTAIEDVQSWIDELGL